MTFYTISVFCLISERLRRFRHIGYIAWFIASLKILANKVDATNTIRDMFSKHKIIYFVWSIQLCFCPLILLFFYPTKTRQIEFEWAHRVNNDKNMAFLFFIFLLKSKQIGFGVDWREQ